MGGNVNFGCFLKRGKVWLVRGSGSEHRLLAVELATVVPEFRFSINIQNGNFVGLKVDRLWWMGGSSGNNLLVCCSGGKRGRGGESNWRAERSRS